MLVIEPAHATTRVSIDMGFLGTRHAHNAMNTGMTSDVAHYIKKSAFAFVWAELPIIGHHLRKDRDFARTSQLLEWACLACVADVPFVIFGSHGSKWHDRQIKAGLAKQRLLMSRHQLCHFGFKVNASSDKPSSTCLVAVAPWKAPLHPCRCEAPREGHHLN